MRQNTAAQFVALLCTVSLVLLVVFDAESRGRGGRGGGGGGFNRGGAAAGGSFGHQRSYGGGNRSNRTNNNDDRMNNRMDDRNDHMNERTDNRQDRYQDRREYADDYYDDRREWVEERQAVRIGAYLTASAFSAMSCSSTIVVVGGVTYNQCGGDWYQRAYRGGSVTYIVVNAPAGY